MAETSERNLRSVDGPLDGEAPDPDAAAKRADAEGKSIEDLGDEREQQIAAGEGEEEDEGPTPPMQIPLIGTAEKISQSWGGARATSSEMRLMGGKQPIEGQFEKGEVVTLIVEAKVFGVAGVDFTDEWGTVNKTVRRHQARIISCRRMGD